MSTENNKLQPLTWNVPIAHSDGTPTVEFQRKWAQQQAQNGTIPALSTPAEVSSVLDVVASASGDILTRSATEWGGVAVSGDGTLSSAGVLTVTKTSGTAFAPSATTDTTNATNITSGTLGSARTPIATTSARGAVIPDGTTVLVDGTGKISTVASGNVTGPSSAVASNFASFNGTTGHIIKDSGLSSASFDAAGAAATAQSNAQIYSSNASHLSSGTVLASLLPLATSSAFGAVKVDAQTIQAVSGIISAKTAGFYYALKSTSNPDLVQSNYGVLPLDSLVFDTHSAYNTTTGRYTAPLSGKWLFMGLILGHTSDLNSTELDCVLSKNGLFAGPSQAVGKSFWFGGGTTAVPATQGNNKASGWALGITTMNGTTDTVELDSWMDGTNGGTNPPTAFAANCFFGGVFLGA